MDCLEIKRDDLLEQYLAGKLEPGPQDELETHLLECAVCARELEVRLITQSEVAANEAAIRTATSTKPWFVFRKTLVFACLSLALLSGVYASYHSGMFAKLFGHQLLLTASTPRKPNAGQDTASAPQGTISIEAQPIEVAPGDCNRPNAQCDFLPTLPAGTKTAASPSPKHGQGPIPSRTEGNSGSAKAAGNQEQATQVAQSAPSKAPDGGTFPVDPGPLARAASANEVSPPTANSNAGELTTAQAVEIYKLGQVEAPPYSFKGLTLGNSPHGKTIPGFSTPGEGGGPGRGKFQNAMKHYVAGRYSEAADFLGDAALLEPQAADIQFYLGACRILIGHPQDSVEAFQKAIAAGKTSYLQPSLYYLAKAYLQMGQLKNAEQELERAASTPGRLTTASKQLLAQVQALKASFERNQIPKP